jgi:hypothetical protein
MDEKFLSTGSTQQTQLTWTLALSGFSLIPVVPGKRVTAERHGINETSCLLPTNVNILVYRVSLNLWSSPSFLNRVIYYSYYRHDVYTYNKLTDYPIGFQEFEAQRFHDSRNMVVARLSALRTGHLYPYEIFRALIPPRSWVDPRSTLRPVGLSQWQLPMTFSGIKPATCWLVAQCLNQLSHRVPSDCI